MAAASGMPDYQWLTVQYPHVLIGDWDEMEAVQLAKEMTPHVLAMLSRPGQTDQPEAYNPRSESPGNPAGGLV
jgi:hypothetical protein